MSSKNANSWEVEAKKVVSKTLKKTMIKIDVAPCKTYKSASICLNTNNNKYFTFIIVRVGL